MRLTIALLDSVFSVVRALFAVAWAEMVSRTAGPFPVKFLLQPLLASALAICDTRASRASLLALILKDPAVRLSRWMVR